ncbi:MAG TPA: lipid-binding SYLF domain-containing protein [Hanamia sp.]|jgi:lipid-binding SYLF domain-containing protein|nr:lipid-binding SYLF domain-containing protein [Hanamia sp.]
MKVSKILFPLLVLSFVFTTAHSQDKQDDKIEAATKVLKDFSEMKESIPQELLKVTQGIIVVPKLINAGFVLAGKRGKGIAMVKLEDGTWSDPVFVTITGGSVGFQAGIQSVDLVLIFKNRETLQDIGKGSFTLGGDISVTAGPVGRNSTASTDYKMEAEVYSYSRSKGLFAGISLSGSAISVDAKANESFYGNDDDAKTIFANTESDSANVQALKDVLKGMVE